MNYLIQLRFKRLSEQKMFWTDRYDKNIMRWFEYLIMTKYIRHHNE